MPNSKLEALKRRSAARKERLQRVERDKRPPYSSPASKLEALKEASKRRNPFLVELQRILGLPVCEDMDQAELDDFNKGFLLADAYQKGWRLLPPQANGILQYQQTGGLFGPIGVGWGKTILTLAMANEAYSRGVDHIMLMIPPNVVEQLLTVDIGYARRHVPITYPHYSLYGLTPKRRLGVARQRRKGVYVMPYSLLSRPDTEELLEELQPELIIADEAHHLARIKDSARGRRVLRYVERFSPGFAAVSGTITGKSIKDYHHLIAWALGKGSPLPLEGHMTERWAELMDSGAIDADGTESTSAVTGHDGESEMRRHSVLPLMQWARETRPDENIEFSTTGFRRAYRIRLETAPGVYSTGDADIGTSLVIANKPVPKADQCSGWDQLQRLYTEVETKWLTPSGDEIEYAVHKWKWLYEIWSGFYNDLYWPSPEQLARQRDISVHRAGELLERAKEHHEAHQEYARKLRKWLQYRARPKLDTPFLVGADMMRHHAENVGFELYDAWTEARQLEFDGMPERWSRAVRVCPFKIEEALLWAADKQSAKKAEERGGIIWVHNIEMGKWCAEALEEAGLDVLYCPAGEAHNKSVIDKTNREKILVCSMRAHGTGKNLQHFRNMLFLQWPRDARQAEQVLGRMHRNGQEADELIAETMNTTDFDRINFAACLNDALYIHQTTGNRQKLIYANYDPLPMVFSSAFLQQHGAEVKMLNSQQESILREKFGVGETQQLGDGQVQLVTAS